MIDGFIEAVDTSTLPPQIRARVASVLAPLVGMRGVRLDMIERQLLLAGDTPGTVLRSTLAPGSTTGAGLLVIEARYQMVTGFLSFDNTLAGVVVPIGRDGLTFNAEFTDARITPIGANDLLAFTSDFNRWSANDSDAV